MADFFSATLRFPGSAFRFTKGEPKHYRAINFATRSFCADCGSPMSFLFDTVQDVWIKIGTLDHPEDWPMTKDASWGQSEHWHTDTKIPWEAISDGLPEVSSTTNMQQKAAENEAGRTSRKGAE